jgi:hypothetical protein
MVNCIVPSSRKKDNGVEPKSMTAGVEPESGFDQSRYMAVRQLRHMPVHIFYKTAALSKLDRYLEESSKNNARTLRSVASNPKEVHICGRRPIEFSKENPLWVGVRLEPLSRVLVSDTKQATINAGLIERRRPLEPNGRQLGSNQSLVPVLDGVSGVARKKARKGRLTWHMAVRSEHFS